jgi:hypothetical protein
LSASWKAFRSSRSGIGLLAAGRKRGNPPVDTFDPVQQLDEDRGGKTRIAQNDPLAARLESNPAFRRLQSDVAKIEHYPAHHQPPGSSFICQAR